MIDMVLVQNLLAVFGCVFGKDTFMALSPLGCPDKQLYLYKKKKRKKSFLLDSNILASSEAGRGNCLLFIYSASVAFLRVRMMNIEIKCKNVK